MREIDRWFSKGKEPSMQQRPICMYCRVPIEIERERYIIRNKGQESDHTRWEYGHLHCYSAAMITATPGVEQSELVACGSCGQDFAHAEIVEHMRACPRR
jgi:hypothetical protein